MKFYKSRKFTLIELLIVIAIISILASLFLPVLQKVKAKARSIYCKNKIRQVYVCFLLYIQDNNGFFPPVYLSGGSKPWYAPSSTFGGEYLKTTSYKKDSPNDIKYSKDNIVYDPANPYHYDSIYMNYALLQSVTKKFSNIRNPSVGVFYIEVGRNDRFVFWASDDVYYGYGWKAVIGCPHNGRSNVLFIDGHALDVVPDDLDTNINFKSINQ